MKNTMVIVAGCLALGTAALAQDQPRQLKGGGHLLGETAEQFYTEGGTAELFRAPRAGRDSASTVRRIQDSSPLRRIEGWNLHLPDPLALEKQPTGPRSPHLDGAPAS